MTFTSICTATPHNANDLTEPLLPQGSGVKAPPASAVIGRNGEDDRDPDTTIVESNESYHKDDTDDPACSCTISMGLDRDKLPHQHQHKYRYKQSHTNSGDVSVVTCQDTTFLLLVFPALIAIQFGIVFWSISNNNNTTNSESTSVPKITVALVDHWPVVNATIALFAISTWLYRLTLQECRVTNVVLLLVPEILLNIVLGLVLFGQALWGFTVLLVSLLALCSLVVLHGVYQLFCDTRDIEDVVESRDDEMYHGEQPKVVDKKRESQDEEEDYGYYCRCHAIVC
jgi:hypothetical protein